MGVAIGPQAEELANKCDAQEILQNIKKIANDCKTESGGSDADIDALFKHQPAGSDKAKCLMTCFMKKMGLVDASAKIDKDSALNVIKAVADGANIEKLGKELIDACKDTPPKGNECESGEAVRECVIAKAKANGFKLPW
ncbi:general odorant-binding protein 19d-like [Anastrepha obliqua]|uniref:general odorant-binding protein 19d-like n=1 Tax=Anastrepha obliqua TaxID=95512 RepID=UPI002409652E|nr:general odorant-binding protein 19d-like [Anastrepha obliqua]